MVANDTAPTPRNRTSTDNRPARRSQSGSARPAAARTSVEQAKRRGPNIVEFVQESRAELRKVTWPTRQEAMNLTGAVIVMTVALSAFLGLIDAILNWGIKPIIGSG
jgi:preprotein translocase subunit SecE